MLTTDIRGLLDVWSEMSSDRVKVQSNTIDRVQTVPKPTRWNSDNCLTESRDWIMGFGSILHTRVDAAGSNMGARGTRADWAAICPLNHHQPLFPLILLKVLLLVPMPTSTSVFSTDHGTEQLWRFSALNWHRAMTEDVEDSKRSSRSVTPINEHLRRKRFGCGEDGYRTVRLGGSNVWVDTGYGL